MYSSCVRIWWGAGNANSMDADEITRSFYKVLLDRLVAVQSVFPLDHLHLPTQTLPLMQASRRITSHTGRLSTGERFAFRDRLDERFHSVIRFCGFAGNLFQQQGIGCTHLSPQCKRE